MGINFQQLSRTRKISICEFFFKETEAQPICRNLLLQSMKRKMSVIRQNKNQNTNLLILHNQSQRIKLKLMKRVLSGLIGGLGKGLKSMFGVNDEVFVQADNEPFKDQKNSVIDVSIGGNLLDSDEVIQDNLKSDDGFQTVLIWLTTLILNPLNQKIQFVFLS